MAKSDVKLLGYSASPYMNRVQIALNFKAIDYDLLEEKFGSKSELLLKSNPVHKKIPVLLHSGRPICESLIIFQYIDEAWTSGPSILPPDPYDRAIARFWAAYIDEKWFPALNDVWFLALKDVRTAEEEEAKLAALERVTEGLVLLEEAFVQCSKGKDFFGGDDIGYLDIAFGGFLGSLRVVDKVADVKLLDEIKTPSLVGWVERFSFHGAVKDVIPETEKLLEIAKMFQAKVKVQSTN